MENELKKGINMKQIIFLAKTAGDTKDTASTIYAVKVPEGFKPTQFARSFFHSANNRKDVQLPEPIIKLANWGVICHDTQSNRNFKIDL